MKSLIVGLFLIMSSTSSFAAGLTETDILGSYALTGNGGFLSYDLTLHADKTANYSQKTIDGTEINCHGSYLFDVTAQQLTTVLNCEMQDILSHEVSFESVTLADLTSGVNLPVLHKSNRGSDATVLMHIQKK